MFKVMFFLWRRSDFSHAAFQDYYENQHAILGARIVPRSSDYRRNYPLWDGAIVLGEKPGVFEMAPFDVMTELTFRDRSGFEAQIHTVTRSPVREELGGDEMKFMDRGLQVLTVVDEVGATANGPAGAAVKLVHFARRKQSLTPATFGTANEMERVGQITGAIGGLVEYRRNYPLLGHPLSYAGGHHNPAQPDAAAFPLDVCEIFWLESEDAVAPAIARLQQEDEVVDVGVSHCVVMTEWRSDFGSRAAPVATKR